MITAEPLFCNDDKIKVCNLTILEAKMDLTSFGPKQARGIFETLIVSSGVVQDFVLAIICKYTL